MHLKCNMVTPGPASPPSYDGQCLPQCPFSGSPAHGLSQLLGHPSPSHPLTPLVSSGTKSCQCYFPGVSVQLLSLRPGLLQASHWAPPHLPLCCRRGLWHRSPDLLSPSKTPPTPLPATERPALTRPLPEGQLPSRRPSCLHFAILSSARSVLSSLSDPAGCRLGLLWGLRCRLLSEALSGPSC